MTAKHTPGPWNACCLETEAHYVFGQNGDETICVLHHNDPSEESFERACGVITKQDRRANARLIAAAPEMLDALGIADFYMREHGIKLPNEARNKIRAAIAKATGETP